MAETQIHPETPKIPGTERAPDIQVEQPAEYPEAQLAAPVEVPTVIPAPPTSRVAPLDAMPAQTSELVREVEHVLSEGLDGTYQQLDPATQARFKIVGEETATKISVLLSDVKDQTKKILQLIMAWLRIIPGVNQFFLEQEAKIKADKLLRLRQPRP